MREADRLREKPEAVAACDRHSSELQILATKAEGKDTARCPPISITTAGPVSASKAAWAATEAVQTLGQLITEARERRGITREQAASQACLPAYYVKMIENDNYDAIPDQLYLVPFFRRYTAFLALDAQEMTSRFIHDLEMAESSVAKISVPITMAARKFLVWRRIALGAFITGIAIVLSYTVWRRIGIARMAKSSSAVAVSSGARPSSATPSVNVELPAAAQQRGQFAGTVAVGRPITTPSARPRIGRLLHASAQRWRRGHRFNPNRHAPVR